MFEEVCISCAEVILLCEVGRTFLHRLELGAFQASDFCQEYVSVFNWTNTLETKSNRYTAVLCFKINTMSL